MDESSYTFLVALVGVLLLLFVVRHTLRRWNDHLVAEANQTLQLPIPGFQTTKRSEIIDRLLADDRLRQMIDQQADATGCPAEQLHRRCRRYADEIVPAFSAVFYFRIGRWLARSLIQSLYRVHVRLADHAAMDAIEPDASVVLVSNHRSNMDVLLITYLTSRRSTLINTAGEWARMWPLFHFVHLAGNCVTDRDAQDVLYKYLFKSFVQLAVRERCNMAVFPEGELTRDGNLQEPKFGLFSYTVSADLQHADRLYLIPVAFNYDRSPEEGNLVAEPDAVYRQRGPLQKFGSTVLATLTYAMRVVLPRRAQFGNACASFGRPISLGRWQSARAIDVADSSSRREWVSELGVDLFQQVSRLVPVLPGHALAVLLVSDDERSWSESALSGEGARLMHEFQAQGCVTCLPDADEVRVFADTVQEFGRRRLVLIDTDGSVRANPDQLPLLRYLANPVSHLRVNT